MKGRKPNDVARKILTANPGKRSTGSAVDSDAPFVCAKLKKPKGLDEYATKEWNRLVSTLAPILSPASAGMVLIAAETFSQIQRAKAAINANGSEFYETTGKSGRMIREHPAVGILGRSMRAYHQALAELGASPVAHTRVKKLPGESQPELPGIARMLG